MRTLVHKPIFRTCSCGATIACIDEEGATLRVIPLLTNMKIMQGLPGDPPVLSGHCPRPGCGRMHYLRDFYVDPKTLTTPLSTDT